MKKYVLMFSCCVFMYNISALQEMDNQQQEASSIHADEYSKMSNSVHDTMVQETQKNEQGSASKIDVQEFNTFMNNLVAPCDTCKQEGATTCLHGNITRVDMQKVLQLFLAITSEAFEKQKQEFSEQQQQLETQLTQQESKKGWWKGFWWGNLSGLAVGGTVGSLGVLIYICKDLHPLR